LIEQLEEISLPALDFAIAMTGFEPSEIDQSSGGTLRARKRGWRLILPHARRGKSVDVLAG